MCVHVHVSEKLKPIPSKCHSLARAHLDVRVAMEEVELATPVWDGSTKIKLRVRVGNEALIEFVQWCVREKLITSVHRPLHAIIAGSDMCDV